MKTLPISNGVYEEAYTAKNFRLLYINTLNDQAIILEMNQQLAYPTIVSYEDFVDDIKKGIYVYKPQENNELFPQLTPNQQKRYELLWEIIKDYVANEPLCYDNRTRAKFSGEAAKKNNMTRTAIEKLLYRFWAEGKTPEAVIPKYNQRGCKSILARDVSQNSKEKFNGCLNASDIKNIDFIIEKHYNKPTMACSMSNAYNIFLDKYYRDEKTKNLVDRYPTFNQFYYHAKKFINERKRVPDRTYNKDNRPIIGSSHSEAIAPGDVYQVDATVMDFYLVSQADPTKLVGRPILYSVADVYSHMIVGIYVGLENPSWESAALALGFAFKEKSEVCAQYKIEELLMENNLKFDWPCKGLPQKIMVDNGELISKASNQLISHLRIEVENAPGWKPDFKGIVEQTFRQYHINLKPYIGGYVEKKSPQRGDPDYKQFAEMNLYEFTRMLILAILFHNSRELERDFILDEDERTAHLAPIPIERWKWGIENRGGNLRIMDSKTLELNLLRQKQATVTPKGIRMGKDLYYSCPRAIDEGWFDRGKTKKGPDKCTVAYDPHAMESIYVIFPNGEVLSSTKTSDYSDFFGWAEEDYQSFFSTQNEERAERAFEQKNMQLLYNDAFKKVIDESKQHNKTNMSSVIPLEDYMVRKDTKGSSINKNRAEEKELQRKNKKPIVLENPLDVATSSNNLDSSNTPINSVGLAIRRLLEEED